MSQPSPNHSAQPAAGLSQLVATFGYVIAFSYPLLALSTGVRAIYQIFVRTDITDKFGPALTAVAAAIYLAATIGFVAREK